MAMRRKTNTRAEYSLWEPKVKYDIIDGVDLGNQTLEDVQVSVL